MLDQWQRIWRGEAGIGPAPVRSGGPVLMIGGRADVAFERAARYGDGWIMGGGAPEQLASGVAKTKAAWQAAGRDGKPRIMSLAYFALGDGAAQAADGYLRHYYGFVGDAAGMIAASAAKDAETVRGYVQAFDDAGCDELVFMPCDPDPGQVDLLAEALA